MTPKSTYSKIFCSRCWRYQSSHCWQWNPILRGEITTDTTRLQANLNRKKQGVNADRGGTQLYTKTSNQTNDRGCTHVLTETISSIWIDQKQPDSGCLKSFTKTIKTNCTQLWVGPTIHFHICALLSTHTILRMRRKEAASFSTAKKWTKQQQNNIQL